MTEAEHRRLERLLLKGPQAHGWKNGLWTAKRVKLLIRREFEIDYHEEHVRKIVKQRLGWSSQKPEQRARERDEDAIERWRHWKFPHIKKGH
jgi:transposase